MKYIVWFSFLFLIGLSVGLADILARLETQVRGLELRFEVVERLVLDAD